MIKDKPKYTVNYKKFKVTFETVNRLPKITRTIEVLAKNEIHARDLVCSEFDTYKYDDKLFSYVPSGKRINIIKTEKVKEDKK
jgi:hypothetical protein